MLTPAKIKPILTASLMISLFYDSLKVKDGQSYLNVTLVYQKGLVVIKSLDMAGLRQPVLSLSKGGIVTLSKTKKPYKPKDSCGWL